MFSIEREEYGITYPVGMLYIDGIETEFAEEGLILTASAAIDSLALIGVAGTMRFVSGGTEYTAPLSGSDFLSGKTGTLYIKITQALALGLHTVALGHPLVIPGAYGYGATGVIQGANSMLWNVNTSVVVQIQSLPTDWRSEVVTAAQVYAVGTITT